MDAHFLTKPYTNYGDVCMDAYVVTPTHVELWGCKVPLVGRRDAAANITEGNGWRLYLTMTVETARQHYSRRLKQYWKAYTPEESSFVRIVCKNGSL